MEGSCGKVSKSMYYGIKSETAKRVFDIWTEKEELNAKLLTYKKI